MVKIHPKRDLKMKDSSKPELIDQKILPNGMTLSFRDVSKKMAGDRWLVKLKCEATLPLIESYFSRISLDDPDFLIFLRERLAGNLSYVVIKERTFVDENDKDNIYQDMLTELQESTVSYIGSSLFPQKLFESHFEKLKKEYDVKKEMDMLKEDAENDEGPADFSACFQD